jgi:hypothetical protein
VPARGLDHDQPVALAEELAAVERELAQKRHARGREVLGIVAVPDDPERVDVVERHVEQGARLVEPRTRGVAPCGRHHSSPGHA